MTVLDVTDLVLGLVLAGFTVLFILRIVLTWYPQANLETFPFNWVAMPTEPFLSPTRKLIPPIGGVDISPVVWVAIVSLLRELLVGEQGLLHLIGR